MQFKFDKNFCNKLNCCMLFKFNEKFSNLIKSQSIYILSEINLIIDTLAGLFALCCVYGSKTKKWLKNGEKKPC